jgi:hypothetical protein
LHLEILYKFYLLTTFFFLKKKEYLNHHFFSGTLLLPDWAAGIILESDTALFPKGLAFVTEDFSSEKFLFEDSSNQVATTVIFSSPA